MNCALEIELSLRCQWSAVLCVQVLWRNRSPLTSQVYFIFHSYFRLQREGQGQMIYADSGMYDGKIYSIYLLSALHPTICAKFSDILKFIFKFLRLFLAFQEAGSIIYVTDEGK